MICPLMSKPIVIKKENGGNHWEEHELFEQHCIKTDCALWVQLGFKSDRVEYCGLTRK